MQARSSPWWWRLEGDGRAEVHAALAVFFPGHARAGEHVLKRILERLMRPCLCLPQANPQRAEDVVVASALVVRLDRRRAAVGDVRDAAMLLEERALDRACARQDEIGNRSGRRQVVVDHHDQVEAHERVEHAMRVGIGEQRVRRVHDERAHRIGLARLHRAEYEIGVG